jgi:amidase
MSERFVAEAAAREHIAHIREMEGDIGAWTELDVEGALASARAMDLEGSPRLLPGRLIAVKDIIDVLGFHTGFGSPIYAGSVPRQDAAAVALIRKAGGIMLGKTVTTEFAYFSPGKTANPHNRKHTPGGSSSGSAAAVAAGMVPIALGTQTAASITRPASFCGVVGFKPSYGHYSLVGVKTFAHSLDTLGVLTGTVADAARVHEVLSQNAVSNDRPVKPGRVGLCRTHAWNRAQAETKAAVEHAGVLLSNAGIDVEEISLPPEFEALPNVQNDIMAYEGARNLAFEYIVHNAQLSEHLKKLIDRGAGLDHEVYRTALDRAVGSRRACSEIFKRCDLVLAPAAVGEAPEGLASTGDPIFSRMWSLLWLPSICLPGFKGPQGLPVGVQFLGAFGEDWKLLAHAAWIEAMFARSIKVGTETRT